MSANERRRAGRHFLQIPGPSPVPERVMRAMDMPVLDHRGPEFQKLGRRVLAKLKGVFRTEDHVFIYPASGTGAWEAALANAFSPGDRILMYETGHFSTLWKNMALKLGLQPEFIASDWRGPWSAPRPAGRGRARRRGHDQIIQRHRLFQAGRCPHRPISGWGCRKVGRILKEVRGVGAC